MVSRKEFMKEQLRLLTSLETKMDELNAKRKESVDLSKLTKKELREQVKLEEYLNTRTRILSATQKLNNDQFNLGIKTFQDYRKAGGTTLEYLSTFMTGTSEKIKILGFEAQAVRRVIYGFLPPGMFRLVNKTASIFNGLGSAFRSIRDGAKDSNNIFTTSFKLLSKFKAPMGSVQQTFDMFTGNSLEGNESLKRKAKQNRKRIKELSKKANPFKGGSLTDAEKTELKGRLKFAKERKMKGDMGLVGGFRRQRKLMKEANKNLLSKFKWKKFSEGIGKFTRSVGGFVKVAFRPVMTFLVMSMVYLAVFSMIVVVIAKTIGEAWKYASTVITPFIGVMLNALSGIWEGLTDVFKGVINGDLGLIVEGVIGIAFNLLQFLLGLALAAVIGLGALVYEMLKVGGKKLVKFFKQTFSSLDNLKENAGKLILIAGAVLALFFGWPALILAVLVTAVPKFIKLIINKVEKLFSFFNTGGTTTGGMSIVGERGPELVKLPSGSKVHSNSTSRSMLARNNNGGNNINITINAKDTSDAEMRRIAEKVGRLVNNSINRNTGMSGIR